jgi:hypothetical protein
MAVHGVDLLLSSLAVRGGLRGERILICLTLGKLGQLNVHLFLFLHAAMQRPLLVAEIELSR